MSTVPISTDGACRGNCTREKELWGEDHSTTNNRMERMAASKGLELLKRQGRVELTTNFQYVRKGITEWEKIWKARGCKTANKKPAMNHDLRRRLERLAGQQAESWHWVKDHSGHRENDIAETLANRGIDELN
jgi:ribonuclease HI